MLGSALDPVAQSLTHDQSGLRGGPGVSDERVQGEMLSLVRGFEHDEACGDVFHEDCLSIGGGSPIVAEGGGESILSTGGAS